MNWDRIEGQWKQRRGQAMHQWGKIMSDDLAGIAGKYEDLVGKLQEKYGIATDEAKHHIEAFKKTVEQLRKANSNLARLQRSLARREKQSRTTAKPRTQHRRQKRSSVKP